MKGLLVSVAVPPMSFVFGVLLGWLIRPKFRRTGGWLFGLSAAGLIVFALPIVSSAMILALERDLPLVPPDGNPPAAIVILGGDVTRTANAPFTQPGRLTLSRLQTGAALHRATGLPILTTGGIVERRRPAIGTIMAISLRDDFGVETAWIEGKSYDTWENAAFSATILKQQGIGSVYVVSNGWHLRRAMIAFRKAGLVATAAPTSTEPPLTPTFADFVPRVGEWIWNYYAMHEWIGCAWYLFR